MSVVPPTIQNAARAAGESWVGRTTVRCWHGFNQPKVLIPIAVGEGAMSAYCTTDLPHKPGHWYDWAPDAAAMGIAAASYAPMIHGRRPGAYVTMTAVSSVLMAGSMGLSAWDARHSIARGAHDAWSGGVRALGHTDPLLAASA